MRRCFLIRSLFALQLERVNQPSAVQAATRRINGSYGHIDVFNFACCADFDLRPDLDTGDEKPVDDRVENEAAPGRVRGKKEEIAAHESRCNVLIGDVPVNGSQRDARVNSRDKTSDDRRFRVLVRRVGGHSTNDARQVALAYAVEVDDGERTDTKMGQLFNEERAASPGPDHANVQTTETRLALRSEQACLPIEPPGNRELTSQRASLQPFDTGTDDDCSIERNVASIGEPDVTGNAVLSEDEPSDGFPATQVEQVREKTVMGGKIVPREGDTRCRTRMAVRRQVRESA